MSDEGLYGKYIIYPAEAAGQFDEYRPIRDAFVLRPNSDPVARKALATYAEQTEDVELSRDLWRWLAVVSDVG